MAGYEVDNSFVLKDLMTGPLKAIIEQVGILNKELKETQGLLSPLMKEMGAFAASTGIVAKELGSMNKSVSGASTRLKNLGERTATAGKAFEAATTAGAKFKDVIGGMNTKVAGLGTTVRTTHEKIGKMASTMERFKGFGRDFGMGFGMGIGLPIYGGAGMMAGTAAADFSKGVVHGSLEYSAEMAAMRGGGKFTDAQIKTAEATAQRMTKMFPSTPSENLKTIREISIATGDASHAIALAPKFGMTEFQMGGAKGLEDREHRRAMMLDIAKVAEKEGVLFNPKTREVDEAGTQKFLDSIVRAAYSSGVDPRNMSTALSNMGMARYGKSDQFMDKLFPAYVFEHGQRAGTMIGQTQNVLTGSTKGMQMLFSNLMQTGMVPKMEPSKTGNFTYQQIMEGMRNMHDLRGKPISTDVMKDPFEAVTGPIKEGMLKFIHKTQAQWDEMDKNAKSMAINQFTGNIQQNAKKTISEWILDETRFRKEMASQGKVGTSDQITATRMRDVATSVERVQKAWETLTQNLGKNQAVTTAIQRSMDTSTRIIQRLDGAFTKLDSKMPNTVHFIDQVSEALGKFTDAVMGTAGVLGKATETVLGGKGLDKLGQAWNTAMGSVGPTQSSGAAFGANIGNAIGGTIRGIATPGIQAYGASKGFLNKLKNPSSFFVPPPPPMAPITDKIVGADQSPLFMHPPAPDKAAAAVAANNKAYLAGLRKKGAVPPAPPTPMLPSAVSSQSPLNARHIVINQTNNIHGGDPKKMTAAAQEGITRALTSSALRHQAFTGTAGGNMNNPYVSGGR